ncbi:MAG: response regulator [Acidobacteria bacterium]|nr:response regulator [Acidobacteriota bacterium]
MLGTARIVSTTAPAASDGQPLENDSPRQPGISPILRVLVIDDDPLIRWAIGETLRERGCTVTDARNGEEALRELIAAPEPFDIILLDYSLPDSRDLALLKTIGGLRPYSRVLVITAFATPELIEEARRAGACRVIAKPFEMRDLASNVLGAYREGRQ